MGAAGTGSAPASQAVVTSKNAAFTSVILRLIFQVGSRPRAPGPNHAPRTDQPPPLLRSASLPPATGRRLWAGSADSFRQPPPPSLSPLTKNPPLPPLQQVSAAYQVPRPAAPAGAASLFLPSPRQV